MSKPQDGLVSRFLNRPISRFITSHMLLKLPIHPSGWTLSILVLPIIAAAYLVRGGYFPVVIGAGLLQVYSILDGCDGEIARAKSLESKMGQRLDTLCDFLASLLFVVSLGIGLQRSTEGLICAALIVLNEVLLLLGGPAVSRPSHEHHSLVSYTRHRAMIEHSGLGNLGSRFVWWILQLTKRDVAVLFFVVLALLDYSPWILHVWLVIAAVSSTLSGIALVRRSSRRESVSA